MLHYRLSCSTFGCALDCVELTSVTVPEDNHAHLLRVLPSRIIICRLSFFITKLNEACLAVQWAVQRWCSDVLNVFIDIQTSKELIQMDTDNMIAVMAAKDKLSSVCSRHNIIVKEKYQNLNSFACILIIKQTFPRIRTHRHTCKFSIISQNACFRL